MIDYSKWKEERPNVTGLKLDPRNPRIPSTGQTLTQRELIAELLENDKVYDLAKNIADNGYYPVESLIVVQEGAEKFVVEGNRRLAALKLLFSPQTAPERWEQKVRSLANRIDPKAIAKVRVVRSPSREAAASIIMSRHTRTQVESWSPLMQAKFYRNLVEGGIEPKEIADQYNVPLSEINAALQRDSMYTVACSLDLPEAIAKTVKNPRVFPVTNLERLYRTPKVNQFLGIAFDDDKRLVGLVNADEFKKGYTKIVTDIAAGKIDSRALNTTLEMDKYLASFGSQRPNLRKTGSFTADDLTQHVRQPSQSARTAVGSKRQRPKRPQWALIPTSFACEVNNQRIIDVCTELKTLAVARYPNAVGLMFRSLLEMSVGYYLDRSGDLKRITDDQRQKRKSKNQSLPHDWHPTLRQMLQYIIDQGNAIITNPNLLKAIKKTVADKESLLSIDTLDLFVHNQHFHPNEETLRSFWTQLQGLFEILMSEPVSRKATR